MSDPQLASALAYLNENSGRYSLEALRNQLLQSGYDPATVEQAVQAYQGSHPAAPKARTGRKILLVIAVNAVLAAVAIGIANLPRISEEVLSVLGAGLFLTGCAEFLGGLLMCFFEKVRSWGLGLLLGFLLSFGLALLILTGWCIFALANGAH